MARRARRRTPEESAVEQTEEKQKAPALTGEQKMLAFRRYGSAAYHKLRSQKTKVSETEVREEAYRMYFHGTA